MFDVGNTSESKQVQAALTHLIRICGGGEVLR
jgi:hypothetical protein